MKLPIDSPLPRFSSATDGNVALALARTGTVSEGARGLSLFLIELKDAQGGPNGIHVHRLKQKYGTKVIFFPVYPTSCAKQVSLVFAHS